GFCAPSSCGVPGAVASARLIAHAEPAARGKKTITAPESGSTAAGTAIRCRTAPDRPGRYSPAATAWLTALPAAVAAVVVAVAPERWPSGRPTVHPAAAPDSCCARPPSYAPAAAESPPAG